MALVLTRGVPGLDSLQPLAPEPNAPPPAPLPINTYSPNVERYRQLAWDEMPDSIKSRPDAAVQLDKFLHTMTWESGGNSESALDPGSDGATGVMRIQNLPGRPSPQALMDPATNIRYAWGLIKRDPDTWTDYGEGGATYDGKPFGALSQHPYGSRAPAYDPNAAPIVSRVMTDPLSTHLSEGQTSGFPAPRMPFSPYQPAPDPWQEPVGQIAAGEAGMEAPYDQQTGPNLLGGGINPNQGGFRGPENPANLEPGPNADYGIFDYGNANVDIPGVTPALEAARGAVSKAVQPTIGAFLPPAAGPGGLPEQNPNAAPIADMVGGLIPTKAVDVATAAAPFLGEAREGATALRGAAERFATEGLGPEAGRTPEAAATAGERLLARGNPGLEGGAFTPEERIARAKKMYQQAREQGMSDEEIAASFGQSAVDAGRGIDVAAQQDAVAAPASDAAAHAAKRVYANTLDATGDLDAASAAARKAAAAASQGIQDQVKPNLLASDDTAAQMAAARGRVRGDTSAINPASDTPQSVTTATEGVAEPTPATTLPEGTPAGGTSTNAPTPVTTTTTTPSGGPTGSSFTPAAGWPGGTPPTPPPGGTRLSDTLFHGASRGIQNFLDAVNGGTSLVTFGHSNIGRQGLPYAVSDLLFNSVGRGKPSIWRQSLRNFYSVLKDPATVSGIKAGLEADPWIDARGLGGVPESLGIRYEDFVTRGAPSPDTLVKELMTKSGLQGNRVSEATHLYIDSLRKTGYSKEAQDLWNMGARDPKDYRALFDTINDATGKGVPRALGGGRVDIAGVNPMLSPGAVFGRFRSWVDPFVQPGSINPLDAGARSVAIRNLMGLGTIVGTTGGIAKLLGDDVNWDINSPLGKIPVGASTFDMSSGYGTVAKLALKGAAAIHSGDWKGLEKTVTDFFRGQLGPVPDIAVDTLTGTDWQDKDFNLYNELKSGNLATRFAPITVNAIKDAIKGNGTFKGLALGSPSLLAVGESTNLVTAARDKATAALSKANPGLSDGKQITSYADAQNYPLLKQQVDRDASVIEAKGSPTQYQQTADQLHKPTIDEVARQEDLFNKGQNGKKLSDVYHDASIENRKTAEALTEQYGDQFKGIPQSAQQKLLQDYYAIDKKLPDDAATDAGGHDYEATDAARQDFVAALPADQQRFLKEALQASENNKTPLHQEYDKYIADKKAAGYFATHVDPKSGQTVGLSAKERTALDVAHPELDVAAWKFGSVGGNAGSSLNSREAVTQALASPDAKNKAVTFAGLKRPINQSPDTLAMWQYSAKPLDWYMNQLPNGQDATNEAKRLAGSTGDKEYAKPLDQMDTKHRSVVTGNLHQAALAGSPELEAFLYVWGERTTLTTQAASDKAGQLIKQYHLNDVKAPIKKAA